MGGLLRRRCQPGIAGGVSVAVIRVEVDMQALDQAIPDLEDVAEPSTKVFCCAPRCPISESAVGEALDDDPITLLDVVEIGDLVYDEAEQLAAVAEQLR